MKEYVRPEMEIDLLDDNCDILTATTSVVDCNPGCAINYAYGEAPDPWA